MMVFQQSWSEIGAGNMKKAKMIEFIVLYLAVYCGIQKTLLLIIHSSEKNERDS